MYKELITWDEAAELLAAPNARPHHPSMPPRDEEALRQALLTRDLFAALELVDDFVGRVDQGEPPCNGESRFCSWEQIFPENAFHLQGWFAVGRADRKTLARGIGISGERALRAVQDDLSVSDVEFEVSLSCDRGNLWFRRADIENLRIHTDSEAATGQASKLGKPAQEKALDERERQSLLRVVRALDVMASLPPRGAASSVQKQLEQLGFSGPGDSTIRKIIEDARALTPD